jgi:uncharacterized protein YbbK (DUF523 family)
VPRDDRPTILVSACLLGTCCNHEGRASRRTQVVGLATDARLVPICPEVAGGLTTPRAAAEIAGGDGDDVLAGRAAVIASDGTDVSAAYVRGAQAAVALARATGATRAVLKARSPSCGPVEIYDGSGTRTLRAGAGVTAAALRAAGVDVQSDGQIDTH